MISVKAPARVCLFGDHQDYLGLPVIACAIDRYITFTAEENSTSTLNFEFKDLKQTRQLNLNDNLNDFGPEDYLKSGLKVLKAQGIELTQGYNILVKGDIPFNAGLSSSSAFVVGWLTLVLRLSHKLKDFTAVEIGHLAYLAECVEHGQFGGKMDQYTSAIGGTVYIDTSKDMTYESLKLPFDQIIVANSGVPKNTISGLKDLNLMAHRAINAIKENVPDFKIEDIDFDNYERYDNYVPQDLKRYYHAAFKNHLITKEAKDGLDTGTLKSEHLGSLMFAHHSILKEELKITTPEIDQLIDIAIQHGAPGKIVGSGGGGCIACVPTKDNKDELMKALEQVGAVEVFAARVSKGAKDLAL